MSEDLPFEKKELTINVHNPNHLPVIDFHELKELQGDLKITTPAQIEKLKNSIRKYGIFVPKFVWIDNKTYYIEDGHQTIKALRELEKGGYAVPPIPFVEIHARDRKDAAEKLLMINSRFADINPETTFFKDFDIELEFMEEIEIPELDLAFEDVGEEIKEDEVPEAPEEPVTQVGDLWRLSKHRVLCGDATKAEDVGRLMDGKKADMVFTDPPYGINVIGGSKSFGSIGGSNIVKVNKYTPIQGDDKAFDPAFLLSLSKNILIFGGNYFANALPNSRCWLVWDKKGRAWDDTFSDCELIWTTFDKPAKIYRHTWMGMIQEGERVKRMHPTQKPVGLYVAILNDHSKENTLISDFFLGSGTTLIAAHQLNRICYGMEIEPKYVDVICQRFFNLTCIDPVRDLDGKKWSELQQK